MHCSSTALRYLEGRLDVTELDDVREVPLGQGALFGSTATRKKLRVSSDEDDVASRQSTNHSTDRDRPSLWRDNINKSLETCLPKINDLCCLPRSPHDPSMVSIPSSSLRSTSHRGSRTRTAHVMKGSQKRRVLRRRCFGSIYTPQSFDPLSVSQSQAVGPYYLPRTLKRPANTYGHRSTLPRHSGQPQSARGLRERRSVSFRTSYLGTRPRSAPQLPEMSFDKFGASELIELFEQPDCKKHSTRRQTYCKISTRPAAAVASIAQRRQHIRQSRQSDQQTVAAIVSAITMVELLQQKPTNKTPGGRLIPSRECGKHTISSEPLLFAPDDRTVWKAMLRSMKLSEASTIA